MIVDFQCLGVLTQEQKEFYWLNTISGSQTWLLAHEPYNLLRDKLGVERIHKSKYDFLNSNKMKEVSDTAKANGIMYEEIVVKELQRECPNNNISHNLDTYLFTTKINNVDMFISSTPDYFILDENGKAKVIGDIKCSTQGDKEQVMLERYYYQALHNCYCFGVYEFELTTKTMVSRPINIYHWTFTQEDFDKYEEMLFNFYFAWSLQQTTYYDDGVEVSTPQAQDQEYIFTNTTYNAEQNEVDSIKRLLQLKNHKKEVEKEISILEEYYKNNYDNLKVESDSVVLEMKASIRKGSYDYQAMLSYLKDKYNINDSELDEFRKDNTIQKTITIKEL